MNVSSGLSLVEVLAEQKVAESAEYAEFCAEALEIVQKVDDEDWREMAEQLLREPDIDDIEFICREFYSLEVA